tara:strand:- start:15 stop:320 length:306 start_codon:yes stop_codon:yes gene_type:complete
MNKKQKKFAALAPPFNKITKADRIVGATGKAYNNGQRPSKMYGGGMAMRKPMQMGGLAQKNRDQQSPMTPKTADAMGMMTDQKRFGMGYNLGGAIKKFKKS